MKTVFLLIVTVCFLTFLAGCAVVTSENLIGDTAVQLSPEAWNGTWKNEETALQFKVIDPENGLLKIAWFEEKDNELQPESLTVQIRKGEQWEYLNLLEGSLYNDLALEKYCWGRIEKEEKRLLFWLPNPERFELAVQSDMLQGKVIKTKKENSPSTHVRLNASSQKLIQQVESNGGDYFLWDKPLTFIKID
ncbi:MAG: hypothetical protein Q3M24_21590 [Candidatus Electrothrix aestuarii]|uniref:Lipoprotein n=1 Tax=Candidatus Electrothrix aestuarii TaxID=3062594 RepID=A0AAU8LU98_9BACT|nr:hypothetical protein [Candidatus Electrothrix aestuarii]